MEHLDNLGNLELADVNEINGVNLDNYFPYQSNGDTVLYVHKRVLKEEAEKAKKAKKKKSKAKNLIHKNNETARNDTILEQTVRFAKHLAPIVIPPDEGSDTPIFYTVEAGSKCRRKEKPKEVKDDATYEKRKCRKIIETYRNDRKIRKQLHSTTDSITHSSQSNTLDDLNINQSLNGTLSEQSEKQEKYIKNEVIKRKRNKDKFIISESLEAIGNELLDTDDTRIKVQLMNDAEKNAFCDSIRSPVLNAVRKCISEFNNIEVKEEIRAVQRVVKHNTDKLDNILDKLANIEKLIQGFGQNKSPQKASTLEQLGEDVDDEKSLEEEFDLKRIRHEDNRVVNLGCGEIVSLRPTSSVGVKTEKTNRIPARYCWTDSNKD